MPQSPSSKPLFVIVLGVTAIIVAVLVWMGVPQWVVFGLPIACLGMLLSVIIAFRCYEAITGKEHPRIGCLMFLVILGIAAVVGAELIQLGVPEWVVCGLPWAFIGISSIPLIFRLLFGPFKYRHYNAALSQADAGDVEGAIERVRELLKSKPNAEHLWVALVELFSRNEQYDDALVALQRAGECGHDPVRQQGGRIVILVKQNRLEEAFAENSRALEQSPDEIIPAANQCSILIAMGRRIEARKLFDQIEAEFLPESFSASERRYRESLLETVRQQLEE